MKVKECLWDPSPKTGHFANLASRQTTVCCL